MTRPKRNNPVRVQARLLAIYNEAASKARAKGGDNIHAMVAANKAYRDAMPPMAGGPATAAYVAALVQGITLKVFTTQEASTLLYAAQVSVTLTRLTGSTNKEKPCHPTNSPAPRSTRTHRP